MLIKEDKQTKDEFNVSRQDISGKTVISGKALTLESHPSDFQNPTIRGITISFILGKYFITFFPK